ncbi:MAG TPA: EAL domain-containing protein [Firmicutes bacterium]|nr:EAL domain-containing protein [Bacillota bacterium]
MTSWKRALRHEELRLYFQPIVECRSLVVRGVEALIRWQHPQLGILLPGQFLPVAEASGPIIHIYKWVLEAVRI